MADKQAVVGLHDIAWGYGDVQVPTYAGKTRTVTRVNLENMPFDNLKTLGEVLNDFLNTLQSNDYNQISANMNKLVLLANHLDEFVTIADNQSLLESVANDLDKIRLVYLNLHSLQYIQALYPQFKRDRDQVKFILCKMERLYQTLNDVVIEAGNLLADKFEPLELKLDAMEARLTDLINTAVQTVQQGNEMAVKLATYTLVIEPKPDCWNPRIIIDDDNQRITWQVPTVSGSCAVIEPDAAIVQSSVDLYLSTLPNLGGGGGSGQVSEALYVSDTNTIIIISGTDLHHSPDWKTYAFIVPADIPSSGSADDPRPKLNDGSGAFDILTNNGQSWLQDNELREGDLVTVQFNGGDQDANGGSAWIIISHITSDEVNQLTQEEINNAVQQGLDNGDIQVGNSVANLGTVVGKADTYAELPTQDQLGNPVTEDDLAILLQTDNDRPAGLYRYVNSEWGYINLGGANSVDELPSQGEVDQEINGEASTASNAVIITYSGD